MDSVRLVDATKGQAFLAAGIEMEAGEGDRVSTGGRDALGERAKERIWIDAEEDPSNPCLLRLSLLGIFSADGLFG